MALIKHEASDGPQPKHTTVVDMVDPEEVHSVNGGALSSGHMPPMWQVPLSLNKSAARRMEKGNDKGYPIHNWRSGIHDPLFIRDRYNHALQHLQMLGNGDMSIDDAQGNADGVTWFCAMINEALRLYPGAVHAAFYAEPRQEKTTDQNTWWWQRTEWFKRAKLALDVLAGKIKKGEF